MIRSNNNMKERHALSPAFDSGVQIGILVWNETDDQIRTTFGARSLNGSVTGATKVNFDIVLRRAVRNEGTCVCPVHPASSSRVLEASRETLRLKGLRIMRRLRAIKTHGMLREAIASSENDDGPALDSATGADELLVTQIPSAETSLCLWLTRAVAVQDLGRRQNASWGAKRVAVNSETEGLRIG